MKMAHQFLEPRLLLGREESVGTKALHDNEGAFVLFFSLHGQHSFQSIQGPTGGCARSLLIALDRSIDCLLGVLLFPNNFNGGNHPPILLAFLTTESCEAIPLPISPPKNALWPFYPYGRYYSLQQWTIVIFTLTLLDR